jgi:phage tail-like protein
MPLRDANGATWYMLRYAHDFAPRVADPIHDPSPPRRDPTLYYDDKRHVLELGPAPPIAEAEPLPGIAVDAAGARYRVDDQGRLVVVACDGSTRLVVCEPGVFARPAGLAIDRRGLLYVADPVARRVVVVDPADGSVRAILNGGLLVEPVDVAVSATGRVYVADRAGGKIAIYSPRLQRTGTIVPPIATPKPIAVMVDHDGSLLVADAYHPRLLRFAADGTRLADEVLAEPPAEPASRVVRFFADTCGPCPADRDGGAWLAEMHRVTRLRALRLARGYATEGMCISAALDGGSPHVQWHRVVVDAEVPAGAVLHIETACSDTPAGFDPSTATWEAPRDASGAVIGITNARAEHLVQSPPGRWLWVRVTLRGDGTATPALRSLQVLYPRVSYLASLPRVFARDPEARRFLDRFLALFERRFTRIEDRYDEFSRELNPDGAPRDVIDWLACLVDLAFDPSWPLAKRRALVGEAMELYKTRGTPAGLARFIEIYTGVRPAILEGFLARPPRPVYLGRPGSVLGCGLPLTSCGTQGMPDQVLFCQFAHRFTVLLYLQDRCDHEVTARVVDRIVAVSKPAHTEHRIVSVLPGARVGMDTSVGLGFVVGADETPRIELGREPHVLGRTAVLGGRHPHSRTLLPGL